MHTATMPTEMPDRRVAVVRPYTRIAGIYDRAVGFRDFLRTRNRFESLVRRYGVNFRSAVDLGCGTGLFACYLAKCWRIPVFGVDSSPEMLRVARCNCRDPRACFILQDARRMYLPHKVDLATANTYTLNHCLTDLELKSVLRSVYGNLTPGGHFVFDLVTHRQPWRGGQCYRAHFFALDQELTQEVRWDPARQLLSILLAHYSHNDLCPPVVESHMGRGYHPLRVGSWLRQIGFFLRGIHDGETLRLASSYSPRVVFVAKRLVHS
jgi:SAM-dependent methyltransferase